MHLLGIGSRISIGVSTVTVVGFRSTKDKIGDIIGCMVICKDNQNKTVEFSNSQIESAIK